MAIAYVKEVAHSTTISGSAPTVSVTNAPAAGNLLVVSVGTSQTGGGPTLSSVTDSKGNTWHVDAVLTDASSTETVGVASTLQDAGALTTSDTITLHFSASVTVTHGAVVVDEFSGCTNTIDQTANGSHLSGGSRNAGTTAATTNANDLVWAAWAANGTETSFTPGAGYTAPTPAFYAPSKTSVEREYKIVAATGTQNPTATGTAFSTIGVTVVYEAATGGSPQSVSATGLGSSAAFGSPTALPGAATASASGLTSSASFGSVTASPGGVTRSVTGLGSSAAFGSPTALPGNVTESVTGLGSQASLGSPSVRNETVVPVSGLTSSATFGVPTFTTTRVINATALGSAGAFGTVTAVPGNSVKQPPSLTAAHAFGVPTVTGGFIVPPTKLTQHTGKGDTPVSGHSGINDTGRAAGGGGVYTEVSQESGGTATPIDQHSGVTGYTEVEES